MTIDEAYQSMLEGNKVTHYSYTPKEYNYIEHGMIKDEGEYVWGTRLDYPWHSRKTEEVLSFGSSSDFISIKLFIFSLV